MDTFVIEQPNENRVCQRQECDKPETTEVSWHLLAPSCPTDGQAMFCDECAEMVRGSAFQAFTRRLAGV